MTRRRWIADRVEGDRAWLTGRNADHLARALRARAGQQFDVVAQGAVRVGTVLSVSPRQVEFQLGTPVETSPLPEISVFLAIFKFDRLEWALEKLTELGVARIVPVITRRTEPHLAGAAAKRVERWRKIAVEAAQQSRRLASPEISVPVLLKKAVASATGCSIVLAEHEEAVSLKSALKEGRPPVNLAIGPEGGWSAEEIQFFKENGWKPVSLGSTILRTETAAIVATAIVLGELS